MADIKAAFFDIDDTLLPFEAKHLPASTVARWPGCAKTASKRLLLPAARRYICRTCTRWTAPPLTAMSR